MKTDELDRSTADIKRYNQEREAYGRRRLMEGALITFERAVDAATTDEERAYAVRRLELGRDAAAVGDFERFLRDCECEVRHVGIRENETCKQSN